MSEQYVPNLGKTPGADARRDAVHIAVAPVIAAESLEPGQHVGLSERGRAILARVGIEGIGVVDPYLTEHVREGEKFWLFLYPGTVTSLRHVWSHPAFKPVVPPAEGKE